MVSSLLLPQRASLPPRPGTTTTTTTVSTIRGLQTLVEQLASRQIAQVSRTAIWVHDLDLGVEPYWSPDLMS
jgi:hypothetical protein